MKSLIDLLKAAGISPSSYDIKDNIAVKGITANSSQVKEGYVFFALKGEKSDGAAFIFQAIQNGAAAIVKDFGTSDSQQEYFSNIICVDNPRLTLAKMAAAFYESQPENIVAVTGTDGKTSTADFFRQFMYLAGKKSASMGTIGVISGEGKNIYESTLTTPDSVALHKMLAELKGGGVDYLAMEASSHGLSQYRLDGVRLCAAAFTNIGRDHLDYHKTEEDYFAAKLRLFGEILPKGGTAVLNEDDKRFTELKYICEKRGHKIIGFGRSGGEFKVNSVIPTGRGQKADLTLFGKEYFVEIALVGEFQVMNILAALGLAVGCGADLEKLLENIDKIKGVSGRLEQVVSTKNGASVFVDYAHTPLALENILKTLRPHTKNKLYVVFGCGGDRDVGKRPLMGKIASGLADFVVVTDDNPRSEDPAAIRAQVMAGCGNKILCKEVADRKNAIYFALEQLQSGDVLVIAGKGHEKVQIIGKEHLRFDDAQVARETAKDLGLDI